MRIVIDGTVGAGKTTILCGESQRDPLRKRFFSFRDEGYRVYSDLVITIVEKMRNLGFSDPSENWPLFFDYAVDLAIEQYHDAQNEEICFFDRSVFFLEILAERYGIELPRKYKEFVRKYRYDEPIFIFEPILTLDMTHPHTSDNKGKVYTLEERLSQHEKVKALYEYYGYRLILIDIGSDDIQESITYRMLRIKEELGI